MMGYAPILTSTEKHTYSVSGQMLMSAYGENKYKPFAMVDTANLTIEQETQELPDAYSGQGNYDKMYSVKAVTLDLDIKTFQPEIIARVFEPYVTTKARGTGLGLAIVKKIVDEHQGIIRINNRQPNGAEVSIRLPLAEQHQLQTSFAATLNES